MPDLPFQVGDSAESRTFQRGFRGAWFRCKIRGIRTRSDSVSYLLEHFDYPDQKLSWTKSYQKPLTHSKNSNGSHRELMVRPSFPTIYHENEKPSISIISEVVVIHDNVWKIGDLVDWWKDGCYWSGTVTKILGNDKVEIGLPSPPVGEGSFYQALRKDLRPSLDWSPEKGWTVPIPMEDGTRRPCARIMNPASSGDVVNIHAVDGIVKVGQQTGRTHSSLLHQDIEGLLDCPDISMARRKQFNTANEMEIDQSYNEIGRTCFQGNVSSSPNDYPAKKLRSNRSLCLNSMTSNTIEAAILDLEELVNRIKWLRDLLNLGVPLSVTEQRLWEFLQHHAPCE